MQYYIENAKMGPVGNAMLWWKKDGRGYTCDLSEAEVFEGGSLEFANIMANSASGKSPKYRAWPKDYIDARITPMVDIQHVDTDFKVEL